MTNLKQQIIRIKKALNTDVIDIRNDIRNKYNIFIDIDNAEWLKETADILTNSDIPDSHIKNNPSLKVINTDPAKDFYSKCNRETGVITLSTQLFDPEFRKKQPFHRIKGVPTLKELLIHEIGHAVGNAHNEKLNKDFEKTFGWAVANGNKNIIDECKKNGYVSSLDSFLNVPIEQLTTIDDKERKRIADKIKLDGIYQKPDKQIKMSWYGITGPKEDMAESYANYILASDNLKRVEPERYQYMKKNVFDNKEYSALQKSIQNMKKILAPYSNLESPYGDIPGSKQELATKKVIANKINRVKKKLRGK